MIKVYFLKSDLNQYQIFPVPSNTGEFVEIEIESENVLNTKQLVLKGGQYVLVDKDTGVNQEVVKKLMDGIDDHAAKIYSTWTRFESEYRERQAAAEAFKSANYEGECSRYISDFAQRARLDNKTATNLILTQAAGLEKLQMELANQRMRKYELKAPNLTLEQLQSIHDDIIKQMDNLMEAYQNG
ncbi:Putative bacteriophage tail collar protein [Haemophilus influenzae]|uniref:HP1 n=3 Tax=Haemophilus influenzae TaxID=727 RepID=A0ABD6WUH9_HAEIF|nr:hypothetical protein BVZ85_01505 [Haemophilus influenzae]PRI65358.1 hypothetical protein BVZ86_00731 [Haemophilus influenzae]PRI75618.1 hypothetical protein BVZ93_00849 [Haemophilus influenzae]PRI76999.1 hypothetical protein BVZ98_01705 [Haemophilus influenzae]PRJ71619.1 hypothetical protein BV123_01603 [Haemophilus influenzae]